MCLISNGGVKIADKDIVCYKIAIVVDNKAISYKGMVSPFWHSPIEFDKLYTEDIFDDYTTWVEKNCIIDINCFHLFTNYDTALEYYGLRKPHTTDNMIIIKAIIPKGTPYIEGFFDSCFGEFDSIATKSVIYQPLD